MTALIVSAVNATASLAAAGYPASQGAVLTASSTGSRAVGPTLYVSAGLLAPPIITLLIENAAASASGKTSTESLYAAAAYAATNTLSPAGFATVATANLAQQAEGQTSYFGALGAESGTRTQKPAAGENTLAAAALSAPTSEFAALAQVNLAGSVG